MIKFFRHIRQRLLSENKFSKYLLYAIGEIVLVVIGILIALQINNWNENRKTGHQEKLYLDRLLSENKQDISTFETNIKDLERGVESVKNFSLAFKSDTVNDSTLIHAANEFFGYGSIYPIFTSSTSTFDDLSSTGNLKVISNTGLREQIVQHYALHQQVEERIQIAIEWALPLDGPFTYENDIMQFEPNTSYLYPEEPIDDLASKLRGAEKKYITNAAAHYWINLDAISQLEILIRQTHLLIAALKAELDQ